MPFCEVNDETLTIEWKHVGKEGATCVRCTDTGEMLADVVNDLSREWEGSGIRIEFRETLLKADEIRQSNRILFNGKLIEAHPGRDVGREFLHFLLRHDRERCRMQNCRA